MYPNGEQLGVVINQDEALLVAHIYQVVKSWLPELKQGTSEVSLTEPNERGEFHLSLDQTDKFASYGSIALDQLQRQIRLDSSEYENCIGMHTPEGNALAMNIDARLDEELQDAGRIKSFTCGLRTAGEQSRARIARSANSLA